MTKETSLKLAEHLLNSLDDGAKEITIRYGTRDFEKKITIAGRPATVGGVHHYTFGDLPLGDLLEDGFESFNDAFNGMKEFYPDLTIESPMTVVYFQLDKFIINYE